MWNSRSLRRTVTHLFFLSVTLLKSVPTRPAGKIDPPAGFPGAPGPGLIVNNIPLLELVWQNSTKV